jgi:hypothetical protein
MFPNQKRGLSFSHVAGFRSGKYWATVLPETALVVTTSWLSGRSCFTERLVAQPQNKIAAQQNRTNQVERWEFNAKNLPHLSGRAKSYPRILPIQIREVRKQNLHFNNAWVKTEFCI